MAKNDPLRDANHLAIGRAVEKLIRKQRVHKSRRLAKLRSQKRLHSMLSGVRVSRA